MTIEEIYKRRFLAGIARVLPWGGRWYEGPDFRGLSIQDTGEGNWQFIHWDDQPRSLVEGMNA